MSSFASIPAPEQGNPWRMAPAATPDPGALLTDPYSDAYVAAMAAVGPVGRVADPWDRCPTCGCANYDPADQGAWQRERTDPPAHDHGFGTDCHTRCRGWR